MMNRIWLIALTFCLGPLGIHRFWVGHRLFGIFFLALTFVTIFGQGLIQNVQQYATYLLLALWILDFFSILLRGEFLLFFRTKNTTNENTDLADEKEKKVMKKSYSDEFKKEVAKAADEKNATLKSVAEKFGVNPTLVRNWKLKFAEQMKI